MASDRPLRLPPPQNLNNTSARPSLQSSTSDFSKHTPEYDTQPTLAYNSSNTTRVQFQQPTNNHPGASTSSSHPPNSNAPYASNSTSANQPTSFSAGAVSRKKSLVRPDRERLDENHRLYNFRAHAAAMEAEGRGVVGVSRTGHTATAGLQDPVVLLSEGGQGSSAFQDATNLRRGKSILAREAGEADESGLSMFKRRGTTLRRPNNHRGDSGQTAMPGGAYDMGRKEKAKAKAMKQPLGPWMIFCLVLTICCPSPLLKCFGLRTKERQSAWREKMGLLAIIAMSMTAVGFLTFGLTEALCGVPASRYLSGDISTGSMIFHGYDYDFSKFAHPAANGIAGGSNPLYNAFAAASMDGSFLFQNVNQNCLDIITPARGTGIPTVGNKLGWYFPCNLYNQWGSSAINKTGYAEGVLCHTQTDARTQFGAIKPIGQVYFNWGQLSNSTRNLGVYNGNVLDFNLLNWLDVSQVAYPPLFDEIKAGNASYRGRDITALMVATSQEKIAQCMVDIIRVGFIDSTTIGCITSQIILYISLAVIIGVVMLRFAMAVVFGWFLSWRIGKFPDETYEQRMQRALEIEQWTGDIYRPAPAKYRPNVKNHKKTMLPTTSRFSKGDLLLAGSTGTGKGDLAGGGRPESKFGDYRKSMAPSMYGSKSMLGAGMRNSPPGSPGPGSRSSSSLPIPSYNSYNFGTNGSKQSTADTGIMGACPFPLIDVVPQPPTDFEPFNYPLAHTILLVTAYSESTEGLRTTLDSLATTDYPNSHKFILVIADGMVKGSGNSLSTPEIVLSMMKELIIPSDDAEALSYVAIADGHKRHNRTKVYAGFYDYDDNTVESSKQQRVPMILLAKIGNPLEAKDAKPGNRGKRDSQIMLMAFLQKVMFDERMSAFEYEFFNSIWRCTGVSPDMYQMILMVDADTKIFPDSVSRMVSCMVNDPEIMGLCGETKIANKTETWVTMIQVFEYYVSHHLTKAFESVFGGVTCLPGCFSMYRIKSPKGGEGYWVPILANPDIVEHYSENVVDTLHKKNLLLLGEDRFLTTLMLRTFPRRKMMFCPQAVCKTVVPDTFRVLLSQRRRWINSTVHNLFELFVVPDLCGVFCFSMRFVVFMELAGTLVLPAAISFTYYLIVIEIIPGTVKPTLPLILLAFILGIPALLIVLTSPQKFVFFGWMLIYLVSLPVWNFLLPGYAFLHMDDFSWGETRKVVGDVAGAHGDKEGEFDSSHIVMKRWADFERERRYRSGVNTRESSYDVMHLSNSPRGPPSNRYSTVSSVETFISNAPPGNQGEALLGRGSPGMSTSTSHGSEPGPQANRYPAQLELPAPLAVQAPRMYEDFSRRVSEVSLPAYPPTAGEDYPRYPNEGYDSDELEREALTFHSPPLDSASFIPHSRPEREQPFHAESIASHQPSSSSNSPPEPIESPLSNNPYAEHLTARKSRGVSLVDDGPVPGTEGVRVVQRQRDSRRVSSGAVPSPPQTGRGGRNSMMVPSFSPTEIPFPSPASPNGSLPPGAAPPRTQKDL